MRNTQKTKISPRDRKVFAHNLRGLMFEHDVSQTELAKALGITQSGVSNICTGKTMPTRERREQICNYMGIDISELYEGIGRLAAQDEEIKKQIRKQLKIMNDAIIELRELIMDLTEE